MFKVNRKTFFVTGFLLVGMTFVLARDQDRINAVYGELPSELAEAANKGRESLGNKISNVFFDRISDINVFSAPLGDDGRLRLKVSRAIFSNNDIEESFTVIDRVRLPLSLPVLSVPLGNAFATFNIGLGGSLDVTNVRLVKPSNALYSAPLLRDLRKGGDLLERARAVLSSEWFATVPKELAPTPPESPDYYETPSETDKPIFLLDSLRKARYGRLWNMVAAPLRLPLRAEWLSRLDQNEVMTYVGSGFIEVGPSLGMTVESAHAKLSDLGISASIRAYLRGEFRIAVMKLGEKRARVKISRRAERGVTGGINSSSRFELYEGFVVLGSRNGRLRTSLVPFTFTADRALGHSFEVGYEFDLNDERAVEAYERAVLGQFGPCDELALETAADGESAPVKRTFSRESEDTRSSRSIGMKIYFLKHTGDSVYTVQDAKIQFPDGTFRVFKARTDASYQRSLGVGIWKSSETIQYSIRTDFLKKLHSQDPAAIGLIAEGRIEDNSTSGVELNRYSEMVESLFGNSKIFPQVPIYLPNNEPEVLAAEADPLTESAKYYQPTRYGYSSFYFRVGLTEAQLLRLANVSPEKMWEHLENGFERSPGSWTRTSGRVVSGAGGWLANAFGWLGDVGDIDQHLGARFFRARSFRDQWLELSGLAEKATTADGQKAFAKKIGEMYSDKIFAYELIKTTMFALRDLGDQDTSFQINAQSAAFGGRELRGGAITEIERITQRYAQETDFDQPSIRQDLTLEVASLKVEQKEDQGNFELKFHASRKPGVVVVKLDELSDYLRVATTLRRLMIPNRGQFNAGVNLFPLDREGKPGFQRELACSLRPGRNYRVTVALIDGENVGPGQSEEFFVNPVKSEGFVGPCPEAELAQ